MGVATRLLPSFLASSLACSSLLTCLISDSPRPTPSEPCNGGHPVAAGTADAVHGPLSARGISQRDLQAGHVDCL